MNNAVKNFFGVFSNYFGYHDNDNFPKVKPELIRYFRTEYGSDWKNALSYHLYKENIKNKKDAA